MSPDLPPAYAGRPQSVVSSPPSYNAGCVSNVLSPLSIPPLEYLYASKRVVVSLGSRIWHTKDPLYGKEGTIRGAIQLNSDKAEALAVTLEGVLRVVTMKRSIPNVVTRIPIFSRTAHLPVDTGQTGFTMQFPTSADSVDEEPLPPTFHAASADTEVEVKYTLTVVLTRKGFHKDESLTFPILYAPRSTCTSAMSLQDRRWKDIVVQPQQTGLNGPRPLAIQISLPLPLRYQSGQPVPFVIAPFLSDRRPIVTVVLSKSVAIDLDSQHFVASRTLNKLILIPTQVRHGVWKVESEISGGKPSGEVVWRFGGVDVVHLVRFRVECEVEGETRTFIHDERVELTTHFAGSPAPLDEPAPGIIADL